MQASPPPTDPARLVSLERTHDLVATHALRLQASGEEKLRVVIQPGNGIHLALELSRSNGRIEAHAVLQQGDYNHLSRHWAELQQQLEPRHIQLGALQQSDGSARGNSSFSHPQRRPSKQESEVVFGGAMTESPLARNPRKKSHLGWETWA